MIVAERAASPAEDPREGKRKGQEVDEVQHVASRHLASSHHYERRGNSAEDPTERGHTVPDPEQLERPLGEHPRLVREELDDV